VAEVARQYRADIGIAVDGDADRVILVDENGAVVDGDQILTMCALDIEAPRRAERGRGRGTVMSNLGMERALQARASAWCAQTSATATWSRPCCARRSTWEASSRVTCVSGPQHDRRRHAVGAAVLALMRREERPLSELARVSAAHAQVLKSVRVRTKTPFGDIPEFRARAGQGRRVARRGQGPDQRALLGHRGRSRA